MMNITDLSHPFKWNNLQTQLLTNAVCPSTTIFFCDFWDVFMTQQTQLSMVNKMLSHVHKVVFSHQGIYREQAGIWEQLICVNILTDEINQGFGRRRGSGMRRHMHAQVGWTTAIFTSRLLAYGCTNTPQCECCTCEVIEYSRRNAFVFMRCTCAPTCPSNFVNDCIHVCACVQVKSHSFCFVLFLL